MLVGMLWVDTNSETTFEQKIKHIKSRFNKKYSFKFGLCDTCYVNPAMLKEETVVEGICIKFDKTFMKGYFWIGNDKARID